MDIDVDFRTDIRDKTVDYVINKYGANAVCNILTKGYQQPKGAIRDAARYYAQTIIAKKGDISKEEVKEIESYYLAIGNRLRKRVPAGLNLSFSSLMNKVDEKWDGNPETTVYGYMKSMYTEDKEALDILDIAKDVEGSFTNYGVHAAGIVISDNDDITDYIPLRYNSKKKCWVTECTKEQVEENGLLKMDFLNLRNLNIITDTLMMIKKNHGISIDINTIPFETEVIKNIFAKGNTTGVFQFESAGMKKYLKQENPESLEDIIILNAMFRPGPLQFIEDVCKVKNGLQPIKYLTPELEPILKKTYGAIVYQEQVMEICQSLAGYTLGQADMVRRYMSKKKTEKLNYERNDFVYGNPERNITGCVANGIDENAANALFDQMTDFAKYAFNKSHAVAYSVVAYQTAWLKYHYTAEYMCTLLNYTDKVEKYLPIINNAKEMGIEVSPPDINKSEEKFSIYDGKILFGLSSVKSVGKAAEKIIQVRRDTGMFASFKDYMLRGHVKNNVDVALIESGAFDGGEYTRSSLLSVAYTDLKDYVAEKNKKEKFIQSAEKVIEIIGKENITDVNILKEAIKEQGFSYQITSKKIPTIDSIKNRIANAKTAIDDFVSQINELKFPRIRENKDLNLSNEKKNLGVYLTGHPIDKYRVVTAPIELVADDTLAITGIISDLTIRYDRSKKEWATFTLEDQSGTISVACFSKDYAKLGFELKEGMCIYAAGKAEVDDFKSTEEETVYRFTASELKQAQEKKDPYILYLPSEADYFFDKADMIRNCKDANGVELVIFFQSTGIHRKLKYLVSETEIAKIGAVKDQ